MPIFTSQRTKYQQSSVSEIVGFRGDRITTGYWFTTYDDLGINMELAIGNPDPANTALVDVYIGGSKKNVSPYSIGPQQRIGLHYGINNGPVHVVSTNGVSIFASERSIYQSNFAEAIGQSDQQMTTDYWFTTYDDVSMIDWMVVGNPDPVNTALVDIYLGGTKLNASPISIGPGQRFFKRYGVSGGPVHVVNTNGVNIFTSDRAKYQQASVTEILGIGGNQLTSDYWYTTYDDLGWITNVILAAP